ncbi:MAG: RNA polymerase sigma factor [Nocardioides sp.]
MESSARTREARFRELYEARYLDVLRYVQRRTGPDHVDDAVAEAFTIAWRRLDDIPIHEAAAAAWLYGVARRVLSNQRRGRDRRIALDLRIAEVARSTNSAADDTGFATMRLDVASAWRQLSATDRETLALSAWEGLTATEAAAVLGITGTAFRLRLSRARRSLRRSMQLSADERSRS